MDGNTKRRWIPWAVGLGAVVGAAIGAGIGSKLPGDVWQGVAIALGAILGGIAALDLLIPAPPKSPSDKSQRIGPFQAVSYFALSTLV
ncbi:MAG: hypothetical protein H7062_00345, partial [Candidatus Saccharimonas sp.]|nr:hypothetical protein [Planctomycetaceae bacterium]